MAMLWMLAAGVLIFLLLCGVLYWQQEKLLFHPQPNDRALLREWGARRVEVPVGSHVKVEAWWADSRAASSNVILYFGGNAEDVLYTLSTAQRFNARRVLAANYRGYGATPGKPTQAALFEDALALYDYAVRQPGIDAQHVVVMGRSLGSGVACWVALNRPVRAVVLITPYDSILAVARRQFGFAPLGLLLKHPFPSAQYAARIEAPVLMLAAERDTIVPPAHARALFAAWAGPKELHVFEGVGHNDIDQHPAYEVRLNHFLEEASAVQVQP
jgi:uncharacterized protein